MPVYVQYIQSFIYFHILQIKHFLHLHFHAKVILHILLFHFLVLLMCNLKRTVTVKYSKCIVKIKIFLISRQEYIKRKISVTVQVQNQHQP